jgi:hypothetical protein
VAARTPERNLRIGIGPARIIPGMIPHEPSSTDWRTEHDSLGEVRVPRRRYWGAQTERSRLNFPIGREPMPKELIYALALVK